MISNLENLNLFRISDFVLRILFVMSRCADLHCGPHSYQECALLPELHRRAVGRAGLAPAKGKPRQIYSLLPLLLSHLPIHSFISQKSRLFNDFAVSFFPRIYFFMVACKQNFWNLPTLTLCLKYFRPGILRIF